MRRFLQSLLAFLARAVIRRQRPRIIGVTGSVGKTSTREAIHAVLDGVFRVRSAVKNYNTEIGLPVTIIGTVPPDRSWWRWLRALVRGCRFAVARARGYPEVLVLEYGADHPGDIAFLTTIATPTIAVITAVGPTHTAFFGSVERVIAEKRRLITVLPRDGIAVLNRDDENVYAMRERTRARVVTYGFHPDAEVQGVEYQVTYGTRNSERGMQNASMGVAFKVATGGSVVPVHLAGCMGRSHASAALAAAAVGVSSGMHLVDIAHALERYVPPPGRMRILGGVKGTTLIDDTYNSSPLAVAAALAAIADVIVSGRRFAILGDMLELGVLTEREHEHVGALIAASGVTDLMTVGEASRSLARGARAAGMPAEHVTEFADAVTAARRVQDLLASGDLVLVKGSQGMRMERAVHELMAEPLRAKDFLCRQDDEWLTKR